MSQLYITDGTKPTIQTRQRDAYHAGKQAWRDDRINAQALQLYEELVRRVGANPYCWIGEESLAADLGRSTSTIKRWMRQLVTARLIRRERQFGHTTHTFITAYDHAEQTPDQGSFFGAGSDPTIRSDLHPDSIKNQQLNLGGGEDRSAENETTHRLQEEGVTDQGVLDELQHHSSDDVDTVVRYVSRCRPRHDVRRAGLIVHLLRRPECLPARRPSLEGTVKSPADVQSDPLHALLWTNVLAQVSADVSPDAFATWLKPTMLLLLDGNTAVIGAPNVFVRDELGKYREHIVTHLSAELGKTVHAEFVIGGG